MLQKVKLGIVDKLGGALAVLCAVHCILLPIFLSFSGFLSHGIVESLFLISAVVFTLVSIYQAYKQGILDFTITSLFVAGIVCILASLILHLHLLSGVGGILLATGHFLNWRLHNRTFHSSAH